MMSATDHTRNWGRYDGSVLFALDRGGLVGAVGDLAARLAPEDAGDRQRDHRGAGGRPDHARDGLGPGDRHDRPAQLAQRPGAADEETRTQTVAAVGRELPLAGGFVDLTDNFTSHTAYVRQVRSHARGLQNLGYLLEPDADEISADVFSVHVACP